MSTYRKDAAPSKPWRREPFRPMVKLVILSRHGLTAAFDERGQQVPWCQGYNADVVDAVLDCAREDCQFEIYPEGRVVGPTLYAQIARSEPIPPDARVHNRADWLGPPVRLSDQK